MKRIVIRLLPLLIVWVSAQAMAQGDPNKTAKNIIKAYKNKDVTLLKSYASGALVSAISENYFESKDAKPLVKIAQEWDGEIRTIRYDKNMIMGNTVVLGYVHIGENISGKLNIVSLTSLNKSDWKAFGLGISEMAEKEFLDASLEISADKPKEKQKPEPKADKTYKGFSVEMANGETLENPSLEKLRAMLKTIDDDNFFLTLNGKTGFLQTTISESGYIIQHNEGGEMFEAESYFTIDKMIELFETYLKGEDWKSMAKWGEM